MNRADCERLHQVGPEIALGIADGEDRAWALDHLSACPACRARIERLSSLADELLLLAPAAEPPAGFEGRVAEAIAPARRIAKAPRRRRLLIGATATLAAAACSAAAVWLALGNDRELADSYRNSLAVANGEYFDAAPIEVPGGEKVGYVYGYQGQTSWVLALIYDGVASGHYELQLVTTSGKRLPLRSLEVSDGKGSVGAATPIPYDDLAEVRLLDGRGREVAESILRD